MSIITGFGTTVNSADLRTADGGFGHANGHAAVEVQFLMTCNILTRSPVSDLPAACSQLRQRRRRSPTAVHADVHRPTRNLVIVDVTVKDKAGKPIEGLKQSDFAVLEDGKPQKISVFEYQKLDHAIPSLRRRSRSPIN